MNTYRVLSMDGGLGSNTAKVLRMISDELDLRVQKKIIKTKDFLNSVDMYAGTSAGGINSLFLANQPNPDISLNRIDVFWENINSSLTAGLLPHSMSVDLQQNPAGVLAELGSRIIGFESLLRNTDYLNALELEFGKVNTLSQLNKKVCIVSFKLDGYNKIDRTVRSWSPKIFNNFVTNNVKDNNELIIDVALRTSAMPIELPIVQSITKTGPGYVDGALVANNPSMIALVQVLRVARETPGDLRGGKVELNEIEMLSIGTGANLISSTEYVEPTFTDGFASWGMNQWLFNLQKPGGVVPTLPPSLNPILVIQALLAPGPFLAIQAFLSASDDAIRFETEEFLQDRFHRLNPKTNIQRTLDVPDAQAKAKAAADWLIKYKWVT